MSYSLDVPTSIMRDILWSFMGDPMEDRDAFSEAVRQYHLNIRDEDVWEPDQVVLQCPEMRLQYRYWEEAEEKEGLLTIQSDNGMSFTAVELLHKVHNAVVEQLREIDHHFFEGFSLLEQRTEGQSPLYRLSQGS